MPDPGTSMSLTAVLVMAAVVLVLLGAWLIAVFRAARQPASGHAHPGGQGAAGSEEQQIDPAHRILDYGGNTLQPARAAPWPMTGRRSPGVLRPGSGAACGSARSGAAYFLRYR
jgi:hypothetical protein